jgi:MFS family permease
MSQSEPDRNPTQRLPATEARAATERAPPVAELAASAAPSPVVAVRAGDSVARAGGLLALPRTFWLLWSGMLVNRLGGSVFFLLPVYFTHERHLRPELAGLVLSLYAAGGMFAGPVGGALADRIGRRPTLLLGTACAGALMLALGGARAIGVIIALAPLLGFFTDICRPAMQAAVADVVAPAQRARAYGLLYWAINLGFAGAAALGGVLAERSFGLLFVIDALTTFAYGAIVFLRVPETRPPRSAARARAASGGREWLAPFRDRRFVAFAAIQLVLLLAFVQVIVVLPLDMRGHGLTTSEIGFLLGLNGVVIVVMQPIALRFLSGFRNAQWLVAGAAFTGIGLGATGLAGGAGVYALTTVLWTLGEIGFSTAAPALVAQLSPVERRGAYQGTFQLGWGLATMLGPVIGSLILARLGPPALWLCCLGACWLAAGLHATFTARWAR